MIIDLGEIHDEYDIIFYEERKRIPLKFGYILKKEEKIPQNLVTFSRVTDVVFISFIMLYFLFGFHFVISFCDVELSYR